MYQTLRQWSQFGIHGPLRQRFSTFSALDILHILWTPYIDRNIQTLRSRGPMLYLKGFQDMYDALWEGINRMLLEVHS